VAHYYVSAKGSDNNAGTEKEPFGTIERARDAVRDAIRAGLDADITVSIRGGTYYVPEGVKFGPEDSGTETHSVTYAAYPGETVTLVGGIRLAEWKPYRGEIWECAIPEGVAPLQVFENGERLTLARTPDEGYYHLERPVEGKEQTAFVYRADDLDPEDWDFADASVIVWPRYDWACCTKPIVAIDTEARVITMGSADGYPMTPGNRYCVQNVLALLDRPGECCISRTEGKVYVWPRHKPIENQTMVISTAENVITVQGERPDKLVRNLHFEGLDLTIANGDAVRVEGAEDCSVRFCLIENAQRCGVLVTNRAQRIHIYGNLIRFHGMNGVYLLGLPPGEPDVNNHHVVENNHIHHCGRLVGHCCGVDIRQSGHNKVVHNHIHHMPRHATGVNGTRYQMLQEQVEGVTWENRHDFLHSRNNLIAYNHIHHVNEDSQDTGAMQSWGPGRDNVYDHNLIHDCGNTEFDWQTGIYLDDATDYFTVTNNIIWGVVGTAYVNSIYAKGIGNKITNNIFIISRRMNAAIASLFMADERADHHEYTRNIFYFENPHGVIYDFYNWSDDRIALSDYNLFWKPEGELRTAGDFKPDHEIRPYGDAHTAPGKTLEEWRAMLDGKYDQHSIVADPLFVDPVNHNYRLETDSPAFALGFQDIDTSRIGLKDDFPARFRNGGEARE
jgi:hypothetical protein